MNHCAKLQFFGYLSFAYKQKSFFLRFTQPYRIQKYEKHCVRCLSKKIMGADRISTAVNKSLTIENV